MTSRFAVPFGAAMTGEEAGPHPELIRQAFNSPFWPWVLITTSVGQEGLDFHRYCRSLVHWNVPSSVVELEQREGRIQRFLSHSVRQKLAKAHGRDALTSAKRSDAQSAQIRALVTSAQMLADKKGRSA
jgi:ERCC4-related helicase